MYLLMYNDIFIYTHIYTDTEYIYIIQISTKKTLHVLLSHLQHFPRPPLHPPWPSSALAMRRLRRATVPALLVTTLTTLTTLVPGPAPAPVLGKLTPVAGLDVGIG